MTKRESFVAIANLLADNAEIVEFCNHEIALLDARKGRAKTPTKAQKANEEVKIVIADVLDGAEEGMRVSDLIADERLASFSSQKVSALLRQMIEEGLVTKTIEKKVSRFFLV